MNEKYLKDVVKISFNNKKWSANGTFYQNGIKINLTILMDFVKYLKKLNIRDCMEDLSIKEFIHLIECEKEKVTLKYIDKIFIKQTVSRYLYIYLNQYIKTKDFTKSNVFLTLIK